MSIFQKSVFAKTHEKSQYSIIFDIFASNSTMVDSTISLIEVGVNEFLVKYPGTLLDGKSC